jgi:hypothetical protein
MKPDFMWFALAALVACELPSPVEHPSVVKRVDMSNDLDVLFVVDNSSSTQDKQALFASNFAALAQSLDSFPMGRPNLHIGVVSTTVGTGSDTDFGSSCPKAAPSDDGLFQNTPRVPGCSAPATGRFLIDVQQGGSRATNYEGTLADAFSCIAQLGTTGCGFEAPLEAMKRALDGSRPENAGFLRPDGDLAVIILTDEDDCSTDGPGLFSLPPTEAGPGDFRCTVQGYDCDTPISATSGGTYRNCHPRHGGYLKNTSAYVDFLHTIKDPSQTMVAVIAGDPTQTISTGAISQPFAQSLALLPSCSYGNMIGRPGLRLDEFRQQFGDQGVFQSVCQPNYTGALQQIGIGIYQMMSPCLDAAVDPVDTDPSNPGRQPSCVVTEHQSASDPGALIPTCKMWSDTMVAADSPLPCWRVDSSTSCTSSGLELQVERTSPPPVGTVVEMRCAAR